MPLCLREQRLLRSDASQFSETYKQTFGKTPTYDATATYTALYSFAKLVQREYASTIFDDNNQSVPFMTILSDPVRRLSCPKPPTWSLALLKPQQPDSPAKQGDGALCLHPCSSTLVYDSLGA